MIDLIECKKHLLKKQKRLKEGNHALFMKAQQDAQKIIQMIVRDYRPMRIYQWGSLLHPDHFQELSDIDIAVEGVTEAEKYFSLLGKAMKMTSFPLDIVQIDKIAPEFAEIIKMKGRVVYGG